VLFNKFLNYVEKGVNREMMGFADNMTGQSTGAVVQRSFCFSEYQHKCNVRLMSTKYHLNSCLLLQLRVGGKE